VFTVQIGTGESNKVICHIVQGAKASVKTVSLAGIVANVN
jgi:hypothetical protein